MYVCISHMHVHCACVCWPMCQSRNMSLGVTGYVFMVWVSSGVFGYSQPSWLSLCTVSLSLCVHVWVCVGVHMCVYECVSSTCADHCAACCCVSVLPGAATTAGCRASHKPPPCPPPYCLLSSFAEKGCPGGW